MKLNRTRVLRALSRFDSATSVEVADALGYNTPNLRHNIWRQLQTFAKEGLADRDGAPGSNIVRFRITGAGRLAMKAAA